MEHSPFTIANCSVMNDSSLLAQLYWIWTSLNKRFLLDSSFSVMLPSECECEAKTLNVLSALYRITYPTPHTALSIFSERSLASLIWCTTSYRYFLSKSLLQKMMGTERDIDDFLPRAIITCSKEAFCCRGT